MIQNLNKLLDGATQDELSACIGLLAKSVVEHRIRSGFVTLRSSSEQTQAGTGDEIESFAQEKELVEEALEMVRVLAAEQAQALETPLETSDQQLEKRKQLRIHVKAPIKVLWPGDTETAEAILENISWGGAAIHVDKLKTDNGDTLQIMVPTSPGSSISVEAKILRSWELADGKGHGLATRFSKLSTRDEAELEKLLMLLAESADDEGQRNHARLTQKLDIHFDDAQELQVTLDDISAGGLGITVPEPLIIGQSLQTVISGIDENFSLTLRARVVRQESMKLGKIEVYHAGLKFEHDQDELKERVGELLRKIAAAKSTKFGWHPPENSNPIPKT